IGRLAQPLRRALRCIRALLRALLLPCLAHRVVRVSQPLQRLRDARIGAVTLRSGTAIALLPGRSRRALCPARLRRAALSLLLALLSRLLAGLLPTLLPLLLLAVLPLLALHL